MLLHPRLNGENLEKNKTVYFKIEKLAKHNCTTAQLALAWVLHQGDDVAPIPGTTKIKNLGNNIGSVTMNLTKEELEEISHAASEVAGPRSYEFCESYNLKYTDTPLPSSCASA